jgi:hypothetical protein
MLSVPSDVSQVFRPPAAVTAALLAVCTTRSVSSKQTGMPGRCVLLCSWNVSHCWSQADSDFDKADAEFDDTAGGYGEGGGYARSRAQLVARGLVSCFPACSSKFAALPR